MKYAVISDIHGDSSYLKIALNTLQSSGISFYLLLGDLINHGPRNGLSREYNPMEIPDLLNPLRHEIIAVKGNCDSEVDQKLLEFPLTSPVNTLIIAGQKAAMSHGHIWKPAHAENLGLRKNDIFMSGHTHAAVLERNSAGIIIFNPGSLTFPKGSRPDHTMGIIDEEAGTVTLTDIFGKTLSSLKILE
jgi:putative phosphoesterase